MTFSGDPVPIDKSADIDIEIQRATIPVTEEPEP